MDPVLAFITQPLIVLVIAVAVFSVRVIYLAKRLRSAGRHPTLADLRALEDAKKSLDAHHESIDGARQTLQGNIGGARDTLRHYKGPFTDSVEGRKQRLKEAMTDLQDFHDPLEQARSQPKIALHAELAAAKKSYKKGLPRGHRRAPKDI